jgi:hypothetical protein
MKICKESSQLWLDTGKNFGVLRQNIINFIVAREVEKTQQRSLGAKWCLDTMLVKEL